MGRTGHWKQFGKTLHKGKDDDLKQAHVCNALAAVVITIRRSAFGLRHASIEQLRPLGPTLDRGLLGKRKALALGPGLGSTFRMTAMIPA